jgi:CRISPR-associated protein Csd1
MEESLFYLFNPPSKKAEDESDEKQVIDADTAQRVRVFLECIREGRLNDHHISGDARFYILGLAPNASRLAVRFWLQSTVSELADKLYRYSRDLEIEPYYRTKDEPKHPAIWQLLCETAVQKKSENVNPLLGGAVMRSILNGGKYPESLLSACIGRIRAEQDNPDKHQYKINYRRMSLIKACLIRNHKKEVSVSLDKIKTDVPYLLGRLFAIFEKAQEDAAGGKLNSTIKDRYFGSAMATPRSIFPILFRLNNHHTSKGEHGGYYAKLIAEVVDMLKADNTPAHLPLEEQGLFAVGYYHQRNDLFRKHEKE